MAYRRKNGPQRSMTFIEDFRSASRFSDEESPLPSNPSLPSPQLAAHAIRASAAHRDSSMLSSAYDENLPRRSSGSKHLTRSVTYATPKDSVAYEYTSMNSLNEAKYGFWGVLARKAKSILEDDNNTHSLSEEHARSHQLAPSTSAGGQGHDASLHNRGSEFASSLQHIGGTIKNALEEGLTMVENRTADMIQETKKLQIGRKSGSFHVRNQPTEFTASSYLYPDLNDHETQLKASRDVANAMAAKAKLLMRELKTVKADLAFAMERCAQLEDENKLLRDNRDTSDSTEDDDLIRLQLETLLEEKRRLAHENSIYARENRFLHEIVEYHQLTMQDVVYVDEGIDEITGFHPMQAPRQLTPSPQRLSPILSRSASLNNSNNSSPPRKNFKKDKELTARSSVSPSSPSSPRQNTIETIDTNNDTKVCSSPSHSPPFIPDNNTNNIEPKAQSSASSPSPLSPSSSLSPKENNTKNVETKAQSSGSSSSLSSPRESNVKNSETTSSLGSPPFPLSPTRDGMKNVEIKERSTAAASSTPSTPSPRSVNKAGGSPLSSPKYEVLRRQRSITPP